MRRLLARLRRLLFRRRPPAEEYWQWNHEARGWEHRMTASELDRDDAARRASREERPWLHRRGPHR